MNNAVIAKSIRLVRRQGTLSETQKAMLLSHNSNTALRSERKSKQRALLASGNLVAAELAKIEESLPTSLWSDDTYVKFMNELRRHHRWLSIVYFYSEDIPRTIRVASLATNILIMLFVQSVTYNVSNRDDGSCRVYLDEVSCLESRSGFATGESKCNWQPSSSKEGPSGVCSFSEPDNSLKAVLFVAILSAMITAPLALMLNYIYVSIISAKTVDGLEDVDVNTQSNCAVSDMLPVSTEHFGETKNDGRNRGSISTFARWTASFANVVTARGSSVHSPLDADNIATTFDKLQTDIKIHRRTLSPSEVTEFDSEYNHA
jgi:hypothetical protein